ncbi:hypothetical protein ABEB36_000372 [Hypothenemus hampei]|uniref:Uncharacterized protein n=1 Tax=Hypothenemus hampei TaxID=57062 RepID=A0ABD1FB22_HYPHA
MKKYPFSLVLPYFTPPSTPFTPRSLVLGKNHLSPHECMEKQRQSKMDSEFSDTSSEMEDNGAGSAKKRKKTGRMTDVMKVLRTESHELGPNCFCKRLQCFKNVYNSYNKRLPLKAAKYRDLFHLVQFLQKPESKDFYKNLTSMDIPAESEDEFIDDPLIDGEIPGED